MDGKGAFMMCTLKGRMHKGGYYDVEKKSVDGKGGITVCKFKDGANLTVGWIREGILMWK